MKLILSSCLLFPAHLPVTLLPELWSQVHSLPSTGAQDEISLNSPSRLVGGTTPEGVMLGESPFVETLRYCAGKSVGVCL